VQGGLHHQRRAEAGLQRQGLRGGLGGLVGLVDVEAAVGPFHPQPGLAVVERSHSVAMAAHGVEVAQRSGHAHARRFTLGARRRVGADRHGQPAHHFAGQGGPAPRQRAAPVRSHRGAIVRKAPTRAHEQRLAGAVGAQVAQRAHGLQALPRQRTGSQALEMRVNLQVQALV
jgi:hypothetical protein